MKKVFLFLLCVYKQQRLWHDCVNEQPCLSLVFLSVLVGSCIVRFCLADNFLLTRPHILDSKVGTCLTSFHLCGEGCDKKKFVFRVFKKYRTNLLSYGD